MCTVQLFWKMQNLLRLKVHECSIHKAPLFSIYATERYTSYSKKDAYKSAHRSTVGHSQNLRDNSNVHQFQVNCEIVITVKSHTAKSRSATTTHSSVDELHKLLREKSQIPNGILVWIWYENGYDIYRVISEDGLEHTAFLLFPGYPEAKENQL